MTRKQLIEIVYNRLSGGVETPDTKKKWHPEMLAYNIGRMYTSVFYDAYRESDMAELDLYAKTYNNTAIQEDVTLLEWYATLPAKPIQILGNQGIRLVSQINDQSSAFAPVESLADGVFSKLEVGIVDSKPSYYVNADRIVFRDLNEDTKTAGVVLIKMIIHFEDMDDGDTVYVPHNKETMIIDGIVERLLNLPPQDTVIDNTKKP